MTGQQRNHRIPRIGAAAAITVAGGTVMVGGQPAAAANFVVDTDSDVQDAVVGNATAGDGFVSLADAIFLANDNADLDTITFNIPGVGPHTIDTVNAQGIKEDLIVTGPGVDQLTLTNSNGQALYVYNDADFTVSNVSISAPTLGLARAAAIIVADGGITTIRDVKIDIVALGIWVKDLGTGVDSVIIENVTVDDSDNDGIKVGDVEMLDVDGLNVTGSTVGMSLGGTGMASIDGLDVTDGSYGLYAVNVELLALTNASITGAINTAINVSESGPTTIDAAVITDGVDGVSVGSFGPDVESLSITNSNFINQTGTAIEADLIDVVDIATTEVTGAGVAAIVIKNSMASTIDGVSVMGGVDGLSVSSTGMDVESASITNSTFTDQSGTAIESELIDDVDVATTTITGSGVGLVVKKATTADLDTVAIDTTAGIGIEGYSVEAWTMKDVTVDEAELSAIQLISSSTAMLEDVTATRAPGGVASSAGRVFTNGVGDLDLIDVTVTGASSSGVAIAGGVEFAATGLDLQNNGGGLALGSTAGSVTESTISGNTLTGVVIDGGDGTIEITESEISDNGAGGVSVSDAGPLTIDGVTIEGNGTVAPSSMGGVQFGPDATPSDMAVLNSTIADNEGDFAGGIGVFDSDVTVLVDTVELRGNKGPVGDALAIRGDADGGGEMFVGNSLITGHTGVGSEVTASSKGAISMYGTPIIDNSGFSIVEAFGEGRIDIQVSDISDNTATSSLVNAHSGTIDISASTISGNTGDSLVESTEAGEVTVESSTITANTTVDSLIASETAGVVDVMFSTLTANSVTDLASTVFAHDGSGVLRADSSILSGNTTVGWVDAPLAAPKPVVDYSLIPSVAGTDVSGTNNVTADDPALGALQDNGSLTDPGGPAERSAVQLLTMLPDKGSPGVDLANPTPASPPLTDQRGLERVVNGRADIGAVERQLSPFVVGLPPARVLETRSGPTFKTIDGDFEGIGRRTNGQETTLKIAGRAGVPADAEAVVINLTGVDPDNVGFATVHPCLVNPPLASSLNFRGDVDSGNELVAELNDDGELCIFNRGVTDLVVDVVGYVPNGSRYSAVGPARLLDTRDTGATIDGLFEKGGIRLSGTELELDVGGRGGVSSDATAVVINVTAVKPVDVGYVTVHPCLPDEPTAASLNFEPGVNRGNEIVAQLNSDGKLCLFTFGSAELVVDVVGQLTSENTYEPVAPARLYETRAAPNGTIDDRQEDEGRLVSGGIVTVEAAGRAGVPADAKGVVVNATAIRTANRGFLTVWDCTGTMPLAASLNYTTGEIVGNELVVDLNADGKFCVFSSRATDLTIDVGGYLN